MQLLDKQEILFFNFKWLIFYCVRTSHKNYLGNDSFTYTASDGKATTTTTILIMISNNGSPTASTSLTSGLAAFDFKKLFIKLASYSIFTIIFSAIF